MTKAIATPNIALIKYWGNRDNALRIPAADSVSMTLDNPIVTIEVEHSPTLKIESFKKDGTKKILKEKDTERFAKVIDLYKKNLGDAIPNSLSIKIRSEIPPSIGIASSAAVFCALAEAVASLIQRGLPGRVLSREEVSVLARLGSGSAARSAFGGFVALEGEVAKQIAPRSHWLLHDVIIVPSREEKKIGSTEGHALAHTSPHFAARVKAIPERMKRCVEAIKTKNFSMLRDVAEEDALDMHHVMETQNPPLRYLTSDTHRITGEIKELRAKKNIDVLFTMDAGPTVHLICNESALKEVKAYAKAQKGAEIFLSKIGAGSQVE